MRGVGSKLPTIPRYADRMGKAVERRGAGFAESIRRWPEASHEDVKAARRYREQGQRTVFLCGWAAAIALFLFVTVFEPVGLPPFAIPLSLLLDLIVCLGCRRHMDNVYSATYSRAAARIGAIQDESERQHQADRLHKVVSVVNDHWERT